MSKAMRVPPDELRAIASDLVRMSAETDHIRGEVRHQWARLDRGWQSYARGDVDGQYRETMREIERMALMLQQMAEALVKTADLIEEADREAAGLFELNDAMAGSNKPPGLVIPSRHTIPTQLPPPIVGLTPLLYRLAIRELYKAVSVPGLPQDLIDNYVNEGDDINLTPEQMLECNPYISIANSNQFDDEYLELLAKGGGAKEITISGPAVAGTNGTLGQFTVNYTGTLTVDAKGNWSFDGDVDFYDVWDFDPKEGGEGRSVIGEIKVRITAEILPGTPFEIHSDQLHVTQSNSDSLVKFTDHPNYIPQPVIDPITETLSPILGEVQPEMEKEVR